MSTNAPFIAPEPVPSPCIKICRMNPASGWCDGCWRTLAEIAAWSTMSEADKRAVCDQLPTRRAQDPSGKSASAGIHST